MKMLFYEIVSCVLHVAIGLHKPNPPRYCSHRDLLLKTILYLLINIESPFNLYVGLAFILPSLCIFLTCI